MAERFDFDRNRTQDREERDRESHWGGERRNDREDWNRGGMNWGEGRPGRDREDWNRGENWGSERGREDWNRGGGMQHWGGDRGREDWNRGNQDYRGMPHREPENRRLEDWNRSGTNLGSNYGENRGREDWNRGGNEWGRGQEWERRGQDWNRGNQEWNRGRNEGGNYGAGSGTYGGNMQGSYYGGAGSYSGSMGDRGQYSGRGPKNYNRSDDRIREDVCERLTHHPQIDASEIEVKVQNGEVTLTGTIDERHAKRMAEDVAEQVSGVREVHNEIRVQQGEHASMSSTSNVRK